MNFWKTVGKFSLIYLGVFILLFPINGLLSMDETHGFFYVTPTKIFIRCLVSLVLTFHIWFRLINRTSL